MAYMYLYKYYTLDMKCVACPQKLVWSPDTNFYHHCINIVKIKNRMTGYSCIIYFVWPHTTQNIK